MVVNAINWVHWRITARNALRLATACVVSLAIIACGATTALAHPQPSIHPAALYQEEPGVTQQLYLIPVDSTLAELQTHLATMSVNDDGNGQVSATMEAEYRLKNPTEDAITVRLAVYYGFGEESPQELVLRAGSSVLPISVDDDGNLTAEISIPSDSSINVSMSYRIPIAGAPLVTIRYAPGVLQRWRGPTSSRIEFAVSNDIVRESWTKTAPNGWTYAPSDATSTSIKWLNDSFIPDEEFIIQFVAPVVWSRLQVAQASIGAGGDADAYLSLGEQYLALATSNAADKIVKDRFTAQAIASFVDGIQRTSDTPSDAPIRMHIRLAGIYRDRAVDPEFDTVLYSTQMVDQAATALELLAPDDARIAELSRWIGDGLRVLFEDARKNHDWTRANNIVQRMADLPPGSIDQALVEEGKQLVLVQQALQLMQRNEQEAAMALLGDSFTYSDAAVPIELQPLFAAWNITATAQNDGMQLDILAMPVVGKETEATRALSEITSSWQQAIASESKNQERWHVTSPASKASGALKIQLRTPSLLSEPILASYVPNTVDFAFLRAALVQLVPETDTQNQLLQKITTLGMPLDLQPVGNLWLDMAAELGRQSRAARTATEDEASDRLLAEMKAANLETTAELWRDLVADSWLLFRYEQEDAGRQPHAWYATPTSAPNYYSIRTQEVETNRLIGLASVALALIAGLTTLFWWLL